MGGILELCLLCLIVGKELKWAVTAQDVGDKCAGNPP